MYVCVYIVCVCVDIHIYIHIHARVCTKSSFDYSCQEMYSWVDTGVHFCMWDRMYMSVCTHACICVWFYYPQPDMHPWTLSQNLHLFMHMYAFMYEHIFFLRMYAYINTHFLIRIYLFTVANANSKILHLCSIYIYTPFYYPHAHPINIEHLPYVYIYMSVYNWICVCVQCICLCMCVHMNQCVCVSI